jgi:hypothetical protein
MVLAPLLATMLFAWSKKHFSLLEKVGGKVKLVVRHPPLEGKGSLPWISLPVSALVLIGYAIRAIGWMQTHVPVVIVMAVMGVLVTLAWRKRTWVMNMAERAMPTDEHALEGAREDWRNRLLPDHMNND